MLVLIIGGSASGKSEFAENLSMRLVNSCNTKKMLYVATMRPFDDECLMRIGRHREMRRHKGFDTKEVYQNLYQVEFEQQSVILLECMSNLLANEMYAKSPPNVSCTENIIKGVEQICAHSDNTIIVSNEVFTDGDRYSEETLIYINQLGEINRRIADMADVVVEVVYSIPLYHKGVLIREE